MTRSVSWLTVTDTRISQLDCFGWEEFVSVKYRYQKLLERALARMRSSPSLAKQVPILGRTRSITRKLWHEPEAKSLKDWLVLLTWVFEFATPVASPSSYPRSSIFLPSINLPQSSFRSTGSIKQNDIIVPAFINEGNSC